MKKIFVFSAAIFSVLTASVPASAGAYAYWHSSDRASFQAPMPVVGALQYHTIRNDETILDIARQYELGFNEIALYHPDLDPWVPKPELSILIPTRWILPVSRYEEVVINIPEMRLYRFFKKIGLVKTYPIGIGRKGFETPPVVSQVADRKRHPSWTTPPSMWESHGRQVIPPGTENPLGDHWIGLSAAHLGIHGTNNSWSIGRLVTRGCIRLYPEHIERLFDEVRVGDKVEIIYEPVKLGVEDGVLLMEVHPDIYDRIPDLHRHAEQLIFQLGLAWDIDWIAVYRCIDLQNGVPAVIGAPAKGGDRLSATATPD